MKEKRSKIMVLCSNSGCPMRLDCLRYSRLTRDLIQVAAFFQPEDKNHCVMYVENQLVIPGIDDERIGTKG